MDNKGWIENNCDAPRKPMKRRRSHKRKTTHDDRVINMAEARREIAHALQLHRSSSSPSSSPATLSAGASSACSSKAKANPNVIGIGSNNIIIETNDQKHNVSFVASDYTRQYFCYSITDALPIPEPVWSTTAPSIVATPPPISLEAPECEWGFENQGASTCSWWLGFLKALDGSVTTNNGVPLPAYPCVDGGVVMDGDPGGTLGVWEPPNLLDPREQSSFADEWLIFPTTEDHHDEADRVTNR